MKLVDKEMLIDHLATCIQIADNKMQDNISVVLQNLKKEVIAGEFDTDSSNVVSEGGVFYV
jgi:hypothetical protein